MRAAESPRSQIGRATPVRRLTARPLLPVSTTDQLLHAGAALKAILLRRAVNR